MEKLKLDLAYYDPICWEESALDNWFENNYHKLGFECVTPSIPIIGCLDYIGVRNGEVLVIELEGKLSCICSHQQWVIDKIDVIICFGGMYNGSSVDIKGKEIIRLTDYPEFLKEAIRPELLENIKKSYRYNEQWRKAVEKKFINDIEIF